MPDIRIIKLTKMGSSLGVAIPAPILRAINLKRGDYLSVALYDEKIISLRVLSDQELQQLKP